jgi:hypothetical protein
MNWANSLTEILGSARTRIGGLGMDDILATANLGNGRSIHVATLARQTIVEAGADHLGFNGYFVFEADDSSAAKGISILGKASSLEAAFRLIDLWGLRTETA